MLKYTFSTREKILLVVFAVIILALLWYVFVFQNVDNQIRAVEANIATEQDKIAVDSAKLAQKKNMEDAINRYVASGARIVEVPTYDNIQNVMAQLNAVLAGTINYSMTFDDIKQGDGGNIERGVTLTFGCNTYADAVNVLNDLARGPYPCRITECAISNGVTSTSRTGVSGVSSAPFSVTTHLVYIENPK